MGQYPIGEEMTCDGCAETQVIAEVEPLTEAYICERCVADERAFRREAHAALRSDVGRTAPKEVTERIVNVVLDAYWAARVRAQLDDEETQR